MTNTACGGALRAELVSSTLLRPPYCSVGQHQPWKGGSAAKNAGRYICATNTKQQEGRQQGNMVRIDGPRNTQAPSPVNLSCTAKLTHAIKQTTRWEQLIDVVHSASALNHIHVTALATQLAALMPSIHALDTGSEISTNRSRKTNTSTSIGVDLAPNGLQAQPLDALHSLVRRVLELVQANMDALDARGIANVVWALARITRALRVLDGQPSDTPMQSPTSSSNETAMNLGLAAAVQASSSTPQHAAKGPANDLQAQAASLGETLLQRAGDSQWGMGFSPQHMANMLWAAAVLDAPLSPLSASSYFAATHGMLSSLNGQGLSNILWACARLGMPPPTDWLQSLYSLPPSQLQQLGPQAVASTLWALAFMSENTSSSGNNSSSTSTSSDAVNGVHSHTASSTAQSTSVENGNGGRASSTQLEGSTPPPEQQQQQQQQHKSSRRGSSQPSSPIFSLPPPAWTHALLSTAQAHMQRTVLHYSGARSTVPHSNINNSAHSPSKPCSPSPTSPQHPPLKLHVHNGATSLHDSPSQPPQTQTVDPQPLPEHFGPQALANTVWSVYKLLGRPPSEAWMATFYAASAAQVDAMEEQQLSSMLWASARLVLGPSLTQPLPLQHSQLPSHQQQQHSCTSSSHGQDSAFHGSLPAYNGSPASATIANSSSSDTSEAQVAHMPTTSTNSSNPQQLTFSSPSSRTPMTSSADGSVTAAPPPEWLSAVAQNVHTRLPSLSDQALANASWSLAMLGWQLDFEQGTSGGCAAEDGKHTSELGEAPGWVDAWRAVLGKRRLRSMTPQAAGMCTTAGVVWSAAEVVHAHAERPWVVQESAAAVQPHPSILTAEQHQQHRQTPHVMQQQAMQQQQLQQQPHEKAHPGEDDKVHQGNADKVNPPPTLPRSASSPPPLSTAAQLQQALLTEEESAHASPGTHTPGAQQRMAFLPKHSASPPGLYKPIRPGPTPSLLMARASATQPTQAQGSHTTGGSTTNRQVQTQTATSIGSPTNTQRRPQASSATNTSANTSSPAPAMSSLTQPQPSQSITTDRPATQAAPSSAHTPPRFIHAHTPMIAWLGDAFAVLADHLQWSMPDLRLEHSQGGSLHGSQAGLQGDQLLSGSLHLNDSSSRSKSSGRGGTSNGADRASDTHGALSKAHCPRELLLAASGPLMALARLQGSPQQPSAVLTKMEALPHLQQQFPQLVLLQGAHKVLQGTHTPQQQHGQCPGFLRTMGRFLAYHADQLPPSEVAACVWALAKIGCVFEAAWVRAVPLNLLSRWVKQAKQQQQQQQQQANRDDSLVPKEAAMLMWACEQWGLGSEVAMVGAQVAAASLSASNRPRKQQRGVQLEQRAQAQACAVPQGQQQEEQGASGGKGTATHSSTGHVRGRATPTVAVALLALARSSSMGSASLMGSQQAPLHPENTGLSALWQHRANGPSQQPQHFTLHPPNPALGPLSSTNQQQAAINSIQQPQPQRQQQQGLPTSVQHQEQQQQRQGLPTSIQHQEQHTQQQRQPPTASKRRRMTAALLQQAGREACWLNAQDLSQVLWSAAALRARPSRDWLRAMQLRTLELASTQQMSRGELPMCVWALARLGLDHVTRPEAATILRACLDMLTPRQVSDHPGSIESPPSSQLMGHIPAQASQHASETSEATQPPRSSEHRAEAIPSGNPSAHLHSSPSQPRSHDSIRPPVKSAARLVHPRRPSQLLCMLWALRAWRVRPSAGWWSAILTDPAWDACLLGAVGAESASLPDKPSASSSAASATSPQPLSSGRADEGWGPAQLVQLLGLLQAQQVQPPVPWIAGLRRRVVLEMQQQQQQQLPQHVLQHGHQQRQQARGHFPSQAQQQQQQNRPSFPVRQLPQPLLPSDAASLLAWSMRVSALHGHTHAAVLGSGSSAGHSKQGPGKSSIQRPAADPSTAAAEAHWLRVAVVLAEQQLPRTSLADMAQLLTALAARHRAIDESQLELFLAKLLAVSRQRMAATLAAHQSCSSESGLLQSMASSSASGDSRDSMSSISRRQQPRGSRGDQVDRNEEVLLLLEGLATVGARPEPEWTQTAADVLGWKLQLGLLDQAQAAKCLPALVTARCNPPRRWLLAYLGRVVVPMLQQRPLPINATSPNSKASPAASTTASGVSPKAPASSDAASVGAQLRAANASQHGGGTTPAPTPGQLSAITSALLKSDPELGRHWLQQLAVTYGG